MKMISSNDKISIKQLKILIYLNACGVGMLALPRQAAQIAGSGGFIIMAGAFLLALIYTLSVTSLAEMFPRETFFEYSQKIAGKFAGIFLSALLFIRIAASSALLLRIFGECVRMTMLYKTPLYVTCGLTAALSLYLAKKGMETRARFAELLIYVALLPFLLIYLTAALKADITRLMPFFETPYQNFAAGAFYLSFSFRALELLLIAYPFCRKPLSVKRAALKAVSGVFVILFSVVLITLMKLGANDTKAQLLPVIQMIDTVKLPARFFERLDAVMLSLWIISALITVSGGIFYSARLLSPYFRKKTEGKNGVSGGIYPALFAAAVIFAVSLMPANVSQVYEWLFWLDLTAGTAFLFIVPVLLILLAKARGMGGGAYAGD